LLIYLLLLLGTIAGDKLALAQSAPTSPGVLLQSGIEKEDVDGDVKSAMTIYDKIATDLSAPRDVRAKALLRLAGCGEKLGRQAKEVYKRILSEYPDQPAAAQARKGLALLNQQVTSAKPVAVEGTTTSSANVSVGVYGHARSTATNVYGVAGDTGSTGYGAGVMGDAYATSGNAFGGFFSTASPDGAAMFAHSSAISGYPIAVTGEVESPNGVAGSFRTHAGSGLVLLGQSGPNYTNVFSVDASGNGFYAGSLTVNGTVSKSGGSFKIDDPLDPLHKTLSHSFVESPDMMNIYNGNVVTDRHGRATVQLPAYFEALNGDFRYQLTVIGRFAQAIVVEKVRDNRFVIETSKPGVEVSWQVTGVRHDAYANAHRIPVEEVKSPSEQGHYLHPGLKETLQRVSK